MNIPQQIHQKPINKNALISSEIPLQSLHSNHRLLIDPHPQPRLLLPLLFGPFFFFSAALDQDLMGDPIFAELSVGRKQSISRAMLCSGDQRGFSSFWVSGHGGFRIGGAKGGGNFAQNESDFGIDGDENVESGNGFGADVVLGGGEIPEDFDFGAVGVVGFGASVFLEESGGGGVELEGNGGGVVEIDGEALSRVGFGPGDGNRTGGGESGGVEAGHGGLDGGRRWRDDGGGGGI